MLLSKGKKGERGGREGGKERMELQRGKGAFAHTKGTDEDIEGTDEAT